MICPDCGIPMNTLEGSESGIMEPKLYVTEETKVCKKCKKQVRESYRAELVEEDDIKVVDLENDI